MQDYFKPKGQVKNFKNDSAGGVVRNSPIIGVVKNNIDPTRGGRIEVYVADFGSPDPDDSKGWITVGYMSPFFGNTKASGPKGEKDYGSYTQNPSSYGMWFSPPDIGSKVVCIFINGDMNYGYYIGSVMDPELLQMVPSIGTSGNVVFNKGEANSYGGATQLPVTNINTNNSSITNGPNFLKAAKPVHSYSASIYFQQGLIRDPVRGPVTTSALRESPSRVGWGVSTPGRPIYEGGYTDDTITTATDSSPEKLKVIARRAGHSIVMDDGDLYGNDQSIRLRTSLGHQILMSDNGQTLFIIHSNGQSYIELGKEGTIDLYSTNSVNIRTQGDLNLHADNNININAKKDLNIAADNIKINSTNNYDVRVGKNYSGYTMGKYTIKVNGSMSMATAGEGSYAAGQLMYINGDKINLNTGATSNPPAEVPLIPQVAHTDTLGDSTKGYAAAPGLLLSIVSRAPAHAPWASAGQGVDVKVTTSASAALPAPASPATSSANNAAAPTAVANPASASTLSTVPGAGAASGALTAGATAGLVGAAASAAGGAAASVVATGSGVITDAAGKINAAVGSLAQTPQQLESAGILKPGASNLVTGLVQNGANVASAMTTNLFTGVAGAENLTKISTNITAQVGAQVANLQKAQTALTNVGAITGSESAASVAGLVSAASSVGVGATADFIKNAAGTSINSAISGVTGGAAALAGGQVAALAGGAGAALAGAAGNAVASAMSAGSLATNLATTATGGLNSITKSLEGIGGGAESLLDKAKGIAGSAFSAITSSFKSFAPGIPQNPLSIVAKNSADFAAGAASNLSGIAASAAGAAASGSGLPGSLASAVGSATAGIANVASGAIGSITSGAGGIAGALGAAASGLTSAASNAISGITSGLPSAASLASGVNNLPGGQGAISAITSAAGGSSVLASIGAAANTISSSVQNGISSASALASGTASLTASGSGALAGLASGANSALAGITGAAGSALAGITGAAGSALAGITGGPGGALAGALAAGKDKLSSLASAGLPAGLGAKLSASINSLNTAGADPIKMPSIGLGTVDRTEITASIGAVLGDLKIPGPNFSGAISAAATGALQAANDISSKLQKYEDERQAIYDKQKQIVNAAKAAYEKADSTLPAGDPEIDKLGMTAIAEMRKAGAILDETSAGRKAILAG